MKKFLLALCLLISCTILHAAYVSDLSYSISNGKVAITGCSSSASGELIIPATLEGYPVTYIGDEAFSMCESLTSVTIPEGVTSIGGWAFEGCRSLTSVTIPSSVTWIRKGAFDGCSNLYKDTNGVQYESEAKVVLINVPTSITGSFIIPNTVRFIHSDAFYDCSGLTSVTIPEGVTEIGEWAFYGCRSLTSVTIPSSVTWIGDYAFEGCRSLTSVTIPEGVTSFAFGMFGYCSSLTSMTIPEGVTEIGDRAFYGCTRLTSVTIPSSVTWIGDSAFEGCSGLSSVHISDIAAWCSIQFFYHQFSSYNSCSNPLSYAQKLYLNGSLVTDLEIPEGVTSIGEGAFYDCSSLTSVVIPEGVTSIGEGAFYDCSSLTSVMIPSSVTTIGDEAFWHCDSLTSVVIPDSVTSIGDYAFSGCSCLPKDENDVQYESEAKVVLIDVPTSVTGEFVIPNTVRFIHSSAFWGCHGLTSVVIPSSVTTIGNNAFYRCSGLTSVTIPSSVTTIGGSAFSGCSSLPKDENGVQYESEAKVVLIDVPESMTGKFEIPNGVRFIYSSAFRDCSGLTSVVIPSSVTSIGESAFEGCSGLSSVHISDIAAWCSIQFSSIYSNPLSYGKISSAKSLYLNGSLVTNLEISSSVTEIGWYAFDSCTSLTSVTIPEGVTEIGAYAFYDCSGLTSVTFEGEPPTVRNTTFSSVGSGCKGYYLSTKAEEWAAVISSGKWNGLTMEMYTPLTFPESVTGETATWLQDALAQLGVTSGNVTLAEGVTVESLEQARLLGITPTIDGTEVAVASTFEVADIAVVDDAVTLSVTIAVEDGTLPSVLSLGGSVKLMVCDTLGGEWTEITPTPSKITLTRVSDTQATLSVTQPRDNAYKFFQVIVKEKE